MAGRIYMKVGDLRPAVDAQLCDRNGPVDLTDALQVLFIMKSLTSGSPKINAAANVIDPLDGRVQYVWTGTDTDTADAYRSEFQVSFPGGIVETFPNDDYIPVIITDDLN